MPKNPLDTLKAAAAAAGVDVEKVEADAALPDIVPSDEEEAAKQTVRAHRVADRGKVCSSCDDPIDPRDRQALREVRGWYHHREEGGQNHVIDRRETGRLMCGPCAARLRAGLTPEQETLL